MLPDNLHDAHDPRLLAVGVVEEGQVALLHGPQVVARDVVADAVPRLRLLLGRQVVDRETDVDAVLVPSLGLGLEQPVRLLLLFAAGGFNVACCLLASSRSGGSGGRRLGRSGGR